MLLAHLLTGDPITELGDNVEPVQVIFQAAMFSPVDDLAVFGRSTNGDERRVYIGVRRNPSLIPSEANSVRLISSYLQFVSDHWQEIQAGRWRLALAVASPNLAVQQVATLAGIARDVPNASFFRGEVARVGRTTQPVRERLRYLDEVVALAAADVNIDTSVASTSELTWRLLTGLRVRELRLEGVDEADRTAVVGRLRATALGKLAVADALFSRLVELAGRYAPTAAIKTRESLLRDLAGMPLSHPPAPEQRSAYNEENFGRSATKERIFVSSCTGQRDKLHPEREAAADAIESTGIAHAWLRERDATAGLNSSEESCIGIAATSDGLVLIVGRKLTPITRKEYEAARGAGVPCFIFIKRGVRPDPEVRAFIEQERHRSVTGHFGSPEELRTRITDALYTFFGSADRRHVLEARMGRVERRADASLITTSPGSGDRGLPPDEAATFEVETDLGFQSSDEVIREARVAAAAGCVVDAFEMLSELAQIANTCGLPHVASGMLAELHTIIPSDALTEAQRAWLLNTEGLTRSGLGERDRATRLFERMRTAGERLGDDSITSTALQNLGCQYALSGKATQAVEFFKKSLNLKNKIGDYFGLAQVFLNLTTSLFEVGEGERAEEALRDLEPLVRSIRDPGLLGSLHLYVGQIAAKRGQFEIAARRLRRALELARRAESPLRVAIVLQNLGAVEVDRGQPARSLQWYRKSLGIVQQLNTPHYLELIHRSIGIALHALGRHREAASEFDRAATLADRYGDQAQWAENIANVGALRLSLRESSAAIGVLNQALDVFQIIGDAKWQALVLENLAMANLQTGDEAGALVLLNRAAGMLTGPSTERADLLRRSAEIALTTGQFDHATNYFEQELRAAEGEPMRQRAWRAATAGSLLSEYGISSVAVGYFDRAVHIYERRGEHELLYRCVNDRAIAYSQQGLPHLARRDLSRCLRLARRREDRAMEQQALMNLGELDRREGRIKAALQRLHKALDLARALGDADVELLTLGNLGLALLHAERWDRAHATFERARSLALSHRRREHEATALAGLARVALHRGRKATAVRLYRRAVALRAERDHRHLAENLAGLVESLAALGRDQELESQLQRLVDLSQVHGHEEVAVDGMTRAAWWLLGRGEREEAAYFYATAIALAAASAVSGQDERTGEAAETSATVLAEALRDPAISIVRDSEALDRDQADALYKLVATMVDERVPEFGETVCHLLEDTAAVFRDDAAHDGSFEECPPRQPGGTSTVP